jgi:hypothetical protein
MLLGIAATACAPDAVAIDGTDTGSDDGGESGLAASGEPALGISIVEVEANQGTRVPIGIGGEWNELRETQLMRGRDTLIRVIIDVDDDWAPRPIEGRLSLTHGDGSTSEWSQVRMIEGDTEERELDTSFYFGLQADLGQTEPGATYAFAMFETGDEGEGLSLGINANPGLGQASIGFEDVALEMNVMFVPIDYEPNGGLTDLSDERRTMLEDRVFQMNPIQRLNVTYHEPVVRSEVLGHMSVMLGVMDQLREAEGAPDNVYYAALLPVGGINGVGGIAALPGLVSANGFGQANPGSDVVRHELGHNQGLRHIYCPGPPSQGDDPAYPYADGHIGNRGFGVRDLVVHRTIDFDIMTYCGNQWVSDWTWRKIWPGIESLTAMGSPGAPPSGGEGTARTWEPPKPTVAVGTRVALINAIIHPDGTSTWWESHGPAPTPESRTGNYEIQWWAGEQLVGSALPGRSVLSDDRSLWLTVPRSEGPPPRVDAAELRWIGPDGNRRSVRSDDWLPPVH